MTQLLICQWCRNRGARRLIMSSIMAIPKNDTRSWLPVACPAHLDGPWLCAPQLWNWARPFAGGARFAGGTRFAGGWNAACWGGVWALRARRRPLQFSNSRWSISVSAGHAQRTARAAVKAAHPATGPRISAVEFMAGLSSEPASCGCAVTSI